MAYRVNCILYRNWCFFFFLVSRLEEFNIFGNWAGGKPKMFRVCNFCTILAEIATLPSLPHTFTQRILLIKIHFIHTTILVSHRHSPYSTNQARSNNILRIINSIFQHHQHNCRPSFGTVQSISPLSLFVFAHVHNFSARRSLQF